MSNMAKNENNSNAKIFILISLIGKEYISIGNLKQKYIELNLNPDIMSLIARNNHFK